jgi:hypothetical protein
LGAGKEQGTLFPELKDTCEEANNDSTAIKVALVDDTLRKTADTLPLAPGHWQNDIMAEEGKADLD